jgi:hypothetical protein
MLGLVAYPFNQDTPITTVGRQGFPERQYLFRQHAADDQ